MVVPHSPRQRSRLSVVSAPHQPSETQANDDVTQPVEDALPDSLSGMLSTRVGTATHKHRSPGRAGSHQPQLQEQWDDSNDTGMDRLRSSARSPFSTQLAGDQAASQHSGVSAASSHTKAPAEQTSSSRGTWEADSASSSTLQMAPMHSRAQQLVTQRAGWGALAARPLPLTTAASWQTPSPWTAAARTLAHIAAEAPGAAGQTCSPSPHPALDSLSVLTGLPRPAADSSSFQRRSTFEGAGGSLLQRATAGPVYGSGALAAPSLAVAATTSHMGSAVGWGAAAGRPNNSSLAAWQAQQFRQLSQLPGQLLEHGTCLRQQLAAVGRQQQQQLWQPSWRGQQRLTGVDDLVVTKQPPIQIQPALGCSGDPALEGPTGSWLHRPLYQDTRVTAAAAATFLNDFIIR